MIETKWCFKLECRELGVDSWDFENLFFPCVCLPGGYTKEVFENWLNTFDILYEELETNCVYPIQNIYNCRLEKISGGGYLIDDKLGNEFYCYICLVDEVRTDVNTNISYRPITR